MARSGPTTFDYIVVGGGTAGVIVAARLAEDANVRVALIEAGPDDRATLLGVPGGASRVSSDPRYQWAWPIEPQAALGGRSVPLVQARVLGGGSSINGMVYSRGAAADYDDWAALGATGWGYEDVLPWFRRSQRSDRAGSAWHGIGGPVATRRGRSPLPIARRLLDALSEAGFPIIDDLNAPAPDGFGWNDWAIDNGRRVSSATAFAGLRHERANLVVITNAQALGLIWQGTHVGGVRITRREHSEALQATRETILSSGAIGSARLLLLSGVGPAEELRALGIPVIVDLPEVGRNLRNHIAYPLAYTVSAPITARRYVHPVRGPLEVARYLARRTGFLSNGAAPVGGFFRSRPELARPDMQLFAIPALLGGKGPLPERHGYMLMINQGRPHSHGMVTLRLSDPAAPPRIDPRYLSDPRDLECLADGIETMRRVPKQPSLAAVTEAELSPGAAVQDREALIASIRARASGYYHVSGTCRMGSDAATSVTSPTLLVHGTTGLSVADASVMPALINGNTNAPVMMIAERAAGFVAERTR